MASEHQIRQYLAYWLQLGKKVVTKNGEQTLLPDPVIEGDRYSPQFEECWQKILDPSSGDSYLEGTEETIRELLTPAWEMMICARCPMPVPVRVQGMPAAVCPCHNLLNWPNTELPLPRPPISSQNHLTVIRNRLLRTPESPQEPQEKQALQQGTLIKLRLDFPSCPGEDSNKDDHNQQWTQSG